ncbi:hypothetical protein, partial [Nocardioides sp.]|uniref:hypothetical protein n=1 Tax=Nocardioides sp. TaxID=35761 RepID=UPI0037C5C4E5
MPFPRTTPVPALAAVLAVSCLALAGCGSDEPPAAAAPVPCAPPVSAAPAEVSGDPDTWPLTGLMVEDGQSIQEH